MNLLSLSLLSDHNLSPLNLKVQHKTEQAKTLDFLIRSQQPSRSNEFERKTQQLQLQNTPTDGRRKRGTILEAADI